MRFLLEKIGRRLAEHLSQPRPQGSQFATSAADKLAAALRPGDVLLVEGNNRISVTIKYLTQSTWSHAALYIGDALGQAPVGEEHRVLIEADLREGVRAVPLSVFANLHTRICRPVGLSPGDLQKVIHFAVSRIGQRYDLKHVFDLARYLIPTPHVPPYWRRHMIAIGHGDPTRAICSTLIAQAFQSVRYPILPQITHEKPDDPIYRHSYKQILHIRNYSLYAPRDFDVSPFFEIVKPTLVSGFDYQHVTWAEDSHRDDPSAIGVEVKE